MNTDDERLLGALKAMWEQGDPPPTDLTRTMVAAVAAADLDDELELLLLVHDSADAPAAATRGVGVARVLYFRAVQGWTLDTEIDGDEVSGQLLDFHGDLDGVQVSVESRGGGRWSAALDESGFFTMTAQLVGWIRFTIDEGGVASSSRWVEL